MKPFIVAAVLVLAFFCAPIPLARAQGWGWNGGGGSSGGSMTASEILTSLLTVDGAASLLDADLLDGNSSQAYLATTMSGASVTCAAGAGASTLALDISCPIAGGNVVVPLVNNDADGCTVTVAETSAALGCRAVIHLVSSAGGTVTMADVSNILDVDASFTPAVGDNITLVYVDLADDRWDETSRSGGITLSGGALTTANSLTVANLTTDTVNISSGNFLKMAAANTTVSAATAATGSFMRISAVGAVAWSPAAGNLDRLVIACNVDAESDVITMTDAASYEGSGCVLGINDCVTMQYDATSSKWREIACNNN